MTDIAKFPSLNNVLYSGTNIASFTATTAIKAGQAVCFHATGVSWSVIPNVTAGTLTVIGVAISNAAAGAKVAVAMVGCIVKVVNADDTTGLDAGDKIMGNDNAVGGTVVLATAGLDSFAVVLEDIAGGSSGFALIQPGKIAAN